MGKATRVDRSRDPRVIAATVTAVACLVPLFVMLILVAPRTINGEMDRAFFYDDFYYYAQTARNIREHSFSSFDGITHTNGYQPLWMLTIVAISYLVEIRPGAFFTVVYCLAASLHVIGTIGLFKLVRAQFPDSSLTPTAGVLYFFFGLLIAVSGMEVVLLFALFPFLAGSWFRFVEHFNAREGAIFGALAALFILARLDAVLLIALLFAFAGTFWLFARPTTFVRATMALSVGVAICCVLVGLYLVWSYVIFGLALPVSGLAKSLRITSGLSWTALDSLIVPHNLLGFILPTGAIILVLGALPVAFLKMHRRVALDWLCLAVLLFPPLFYATTAWRSDWKIMPWYYYPLIFAVPFSLLLLEKQLRRRIPVFSLSFGNWLAATAALLMAASVTVKSLGGTTVYDEISLQQVNQLLPFAKEHPGVYAMGDAAGLFGFLLDRPVVHLEGLVADSRMLDYISRSASLTEVFSAYGVRYYVTVDVPIDARPEENCWRVQEPGTSGPLAPKMNGTLCVAPIIDRVSEFRGLQRRLMVFDTSRLNLRPR